MNSTYSKYSNWMHEVFLNSLTLCNMIAEKPKYCTKVIKLSKIYNAALGTQQIEIQLQTIKGGNKIICLR